MRTTIRSRVDCPCMSARQYCIGQLTVATMATVEYQCRVSCYQPLPPAPSSTVTPRHATIDVNFLTLSNRPLRYQEPYNHGHLLVIFVEYFLLNFMPLSNPVIVVFPNTSNSRKQT
ncbi:hypothetical protein J6590_096333 [Homalodisca vitripennis]|nr:hypothetical protein J6590_096333 [Homalodisca vitripennis]